MAVTPTVYGPPTGAFEIVRVELAVGLTDDGEKEQVAPDGQFEVENETELEKPF